MPTKPENSTPDRKFSVENLVAGAATSTQPLCFRPSSLRLDVAFLCAIQVYEIVFGCLDVRPESATMGSASLFVTTRS
jgi:hypothetical protein